MFEDTDAGGVVYYGTYLRYLERGRTEYLRELGVSVRDLAEGGVLFPVVHADVHYRSPAFYDDLLVIETRVNEVGRTRTVFGTMIRREGEESVLVEAEVTVACVDRTMKPRRRPPELDMLLKRRKNPD